VQQFTDDLQAIGFGSYTDYLKSPLWASIRSRVYASKGRMCLGCKTRRATQIHHRQYDLDTLKGDTLNYLIPICRQCHRAEHGLEPTRQVAPIVIPWNPNQRCPSKRKGKASGGTKKARQQYNAGRKQQKRAARRAAQNECMTRPKQVVCKECRKTVKLPAEISWVDYVCDRCKRVAIGVAANKASIKARRESRQQCEQIMSMARASVQADPKGATGALREFVKSARIAESLPADRKRTRH
jgi:hypothetical protein